MTPDATAAEAAVSDEVVTLTLAAPIVTAPILNPLIVTVKSTEAPIAAPVDEITTNAAVVAPHVAVSPATLLAPDLTVGVTDDAKKPEG